MSSTGSCFELFCSTIKDSTFLTIKNSNILLIVKAYIKPTTCIMMSSNFRIEFVSSPLPLSIYSFTVGVCVWNCDLWALRKLCLWYEISQFLVFHGTQYPSPILLGHYSFQFLLLSYTGSCNIKVTNGCQYKEVAICLRCHLWLIYLSSILFYLNLSLRANVDESKKKSKCYSASARFSW